jgi:predicted SAM-dependent methyltransferase
VDLTSTNFSDNQFDLVIANHVLEHIEKDREALFEIFRILKPGVFAILQAPFSLLLPNALECRELKDERLRNFLFGQEDHVRLYGMDYFERMRNVGFNVEVIDHSEILTLIDSAKYEVNSQEPLIIAKK